MKRVLSLLLSVVLLLGVSACRQQESGFVNPVTFEDIPDEDRAILAELPDGFVSADNMPEAPGVLVHDNTKAVIDYSNNADGYVMVQYKMDSEFRLKCQVTGPDEITYTYNLTPEEWAVFPLTAGDGKYKVTVYQETKNGSGKYATVLSKTMEVVLENEFEPFLRPNQYVNYDGEPKTVELAAELVGDLAPLDAVAAVYDWVVTNLTYDKQKAKTVQSGYLPDLDDVLEAKQGICFDYAALMAGMLRSQGIPCKLVVGYAGTAYHAWISVWTEETGWINNAVFFDGETWQRMAPTFASSGHQSDAIMKYIGDGSHYKECYIY